MLDFQIRLGKRIRTARKAKGWTQEELAERTGLTAAFISYLENGSRSASLESLQKLAASLGLELELLLGGSLARSPLRQRFAGMSLEGISSGDGELLKRLARSLRKKRR